MHLLHAVETLSRRAGGLPVAVGDLAAGIANSTVATGVDLLSSAGPDNLSAPDAVSVSLVEGGWLAGFRAAGRLAELHDIAPFNLIHQHGIWAPLPVAAGRFGRRHSLPLVISPHGMLEPWALNHHAARKRVAWLLYQHRNLESAGLLHATSDSEADHFRNLGFAAPIAVIPLGVRPVPASPLDPEAAGAPRKRSRVLMLSRIHPKKGIDLLLRAWAEIEAQDWELVIAGNDEGGHQAALEAQASQLNLGNRVRFAAPLFGRDKDTAFRQADLFVLPSHSENFGIVVPEALQYGLPVITTTGTPWQNLSAERCGWWVDPTPASLEKALREAIALSESEREAMGRRGISLVERVHRWPRLVERFGEIYRWLGDGGKARPDWLRID